MWWKEINSNVVLSWATSSRIGVSKMLWHLWALFNQFIISIKSLKTWMCQTPFSWAMVININIANNSALLFEPSPKLHFNLKRWFSVRCNIAPTPHLMGLPCATLSKCPQGYVLSIVSDRMSLILCGLSTAMKCAVMAIMFDATVWGLVTFPSKMPLLWFIQIPQLTMAGNDLYWDIVQSESQRDKACS